MTDTKIISTSTQTKKEQTIDKLNITREEPKTFTSGHSAYINTKERNKAKPKFVSSKILANNGKKLVKVRTIEFMKN
jgi:ribosomal protein S19